MTTLKPGHSYRIKELNNKQVSSTYRHKLLAMGLVPGATFKVIRLAPLGDTLQINTNGFLLSVRAKELKHLQFEMLLP